MPDSNLFNFVGPGYKSQSIVADGEVSMNLYPERIESGQGKGGSQWVLYGTPGLKLFCTLPDKPVRCLWANETRLFAIAGATLFEIYQDGTFRTAATGLENSQNPAQIFPNAIGTQLFIVSGGVGYCTDEPIAPVTPAIAAGTGTFIDGYFVASQPGTNQFNLSALNNGLSWDPLQAGVKQGYADHIAAVFACNELLWLFGDETTEVWQDTGALNFPFQRIPGAFIELGTAPYSVAKVDTTLMWLAINTRGQGVVYLANGWQPIRASNHAVEAAIQTYSKISDAVAYSYQENGHQFYVLSFPTVNTTWVYDLVTNEWHQRGHWNVGTGSYDAALARTHAFVFDQHFVGSYQDGKVYQQGLQYYDEAGSPLRRLRSSPHISQQMDWMRYNAFQVDMQVGYAGAGQNPQVMMQFSDDGGNTFSNEIWQSAGKTGQYTYRVRYRRLGRSRDRVFRIVVSDPIQVSIVNAFVNVTPGDGT